MSANKNKITFNSVSVDIGCSSCKRTKLSTIFHPKPKPPPYQKHKHSLHLNNYYFHSSSSSSSTHSSSSKTASNPTPNTSTPSQFLDDPFYSSPSRSTLRGFGRVGGQSVAVEKESDDPYLDFRHSMLQMILEKEIYSKDDLRELLNCFLQLNSPYYHGVIVRAFTEIWNGVFSVRSSDNNNNNNNFSVSGSGSAKLHYYYGCNSRDF